MHLSLFHNLHNVDPFANFVAGLGVAISRFRSSSNGNRCLPRPTKKRRRLRIRRKKSATNRISLSIFDCFGIKKGACFAIIASLTLRILDGSSRPRPEEEQVLKGSSRQFIFGEILPQEFATLRRRNFKISPLRPCMKQIWTRRTFRFQLCN